MRTNVGSVKANLTLSCGPGGDIRILLQEQARAGDDQQDGGYPPDAANREGGGSQAADQADDKSGGEKKGGGLTRVESAAWFLDDAEQEPDQCCQSRELKEHPPRFVPGVYEKDAGHLLIKRV